MIQEDLGWKQRVQKEERSKSLSARGEQTRNLLGGGIPLGPALPGGEFAPIGLLPDLSGGLDALSGAGSLGAPSLTSRTSRRRPWSLGSASVKSRMSSYARSMSSSHPRRRRHGRGALERLLDEGSTYLQNPQPLEALFGEHPPGVQESRGRYSRNPGKYRDHIGLTHYHIAT
mmetsp:Transcript_33927/g.107788  ORF Transcript_33927/g.107788 Transcript_33927/m.107788 type:complete len:173 (-) Transcript_33927:102-620(-)